jgi:hypothetical protein
MCKANEFLTNLSRLSPEELAAQYQEIGEGMCEESDDRLLPGWVKMLTVVDAVGKFKYGHQYEEANSKIALNALLS